MAHSAQSERSSGRFQSGPALSRVRLRVVPNPGTCALSSQSLSCRRCDRGQCGPVDPWENHSGPTLSHMRPRAV
ncbi:hypothetical protein NDU88_002590 [Pleurodeles waltl]|uniref:Uncharacterized protein n=1 Tax=Pleurodeles waltl TaxID=8319 RepID=A0AAV7WS52_PLEWA|nr:hypothetical protein NDU88_002590 [Pleurodeles waltl]